MHAKSHLGENQTDYYLVDTYSRSIQKEIFFGNFTTDWQ